jgi:uncharacterized MnhB-related membrane protein
MGPEFFRYAYLSGALLYLLLWGLVFLRRADLRREMVCMGALSVLYAVPHELLIWTPDWWHPQTITGTTVGVEDLLYGFGNGGVLAVIFALVFRLEARPAGDTLPVPYRAVPYAINALLPLVLVLALGLHSFIASGLGALLALALVLRTRPDLLGAAVWSAVLGTLVSFPFYWLMRVLLPGYIASTWYLERLSGIDLLGIPVEDVIWYLYTAAFLGTYFKFAASLSVKPMRVEAAPLAR